MKRNFAYTATAILASVMTLSAVGASAQDAVDPAAQPAVPPIQQTPTTDPSASPTQPPEPGTPPIATAPATAAAPAGTAPKDFIQQAYLANEFSVAAAQVALKQGTDADVKAAAQAALTQGTQTRQDMITAIQGSTADMHFDQTWTDEYKQKLSDLQGSAGAEFDAKYVDLQSAELDKASELFQSYASSATDASTKTFASNTLPKLQAQATQFDAAAPTATAGTR